MDIMLNEAEIEQTPMPQVLFQDFAESNLNFSMVFFCNIATISSLPEVKSKVRFQLDEKLRHHKVQMAFPQRDLNLKIDQPIDVKVLS